MLPSRGTLGIAPLLATGLVLLSAPSFAQTSPAPASKPVPAVIGSSPKASSPKTRHHDKKSQPIAEAPQPAPVPPTLEEQPPTPPQVTYRDGQLSIVSTNATLSQILRSVQQQTGAVIDVPPGSGNERVVAKLGPGKPQAVLSSLLDGSKFNYVILGESKNPGAVQKVVLLAKSGGGASEPTVNTAQNNIRPQPPIPQPQPGVEPPEDEYPPNEPEVEQQQVPGAPGFPGSENLQPEVINPGNRTPEQMLQELQRMQQQQQQMQQQLNPANQQPPPQQPAFPNPAQPSPQPQ